MSAVAPQIGLVHEGYSWGYYVMGGEDGQQLDKTFSLNFSRFVAVQTLNRKLSISDPILHRTRDPRSNSAMAMVSHLHHLFDPEMCQASSHTLRWKDRPLQCPRCQSHHVGPWGTYHYQPALQHYRCQEKACKRTFHAPTGT